MTVKDIFSFLKEVPLFKDYQDITLKKIIDESQIITFESNEAIIEYGKEGRFLGILIEGTAEISIRDNSGESHQLMTLKAGDVFGEISMMTGEKNPADVIGISRCKAIIIPQAIFSSEMLIHPSTVRYLSRIITDRLKNSPLAQGNKDFQDPSFRKSEDPYGFRLESKTPEKILVINCGSSSLKYHLFDTSDEKRNAFGSVEKIGENGTRHTIHLNSTHKTKDLPKGDHAAAFASMIEELTSSSVIKSKDEITAVGHRVVHGGDRFSGAEVVTEDVKNAIAELGAFAPLHNPVHLIGIEEAQKTFPGAVHVVVFDTAFHHTLPPYAFLYGLPYHYYEQYKIRKYGAHGTSHSYVALKGSQAIKRHLNELEIISCHLGNGSSVCAIDHGRSVDTSMGLTPTEGLIMGTRCGNIDPAALVYIMKTDNLNVQQAEHMITRQSGLLGISGISNDMRTIDQAAQEGDHRALLAIKTYCYQIRKYIGSYIAVMGRLDLLIFTGGIGQGSSTVRSLACQGLEYLGIEIDEEKNRKANGFTEVSDISMDDAPVRTLVVPTNEELMIARETLRALGKHRTTRIITSTPRDVPIEVSAHHVHLSQEHVEALFGKGHQLTNESELSQPGQYACAEKVTLVGPKGKIERVRVLGPARKETQIEISMTEQFKLGIHPPVRESGDLKDTPGVTLVGPAGSVTIEKGVICAQRHIHMTPADALSMGLVDRCMVRVKVDSPGRNLIFGDVVVRVHPSFRLAMHIDTDEANAAGIKTGVKGIIEGIQNELV